MQAEELIAAHITAVRGTWDAETDDVLVCRQVRRETHDVKTFVLGAAQPALFRYRPGQFLTFDLRSAGERINRCYTISSSPARPHLISITVKRVPGGPVSNWLHDTLKPGMSSGGRAHGRVHRLRSRRTQIPVPVGRQRHHAA